MLAINQQIFEYLLPLGRPVSVPFYSHTQDILEYALTTDDSISLETRDLEDTFYVKLMIHKDRLVEFFGKAHYMPLSPYTIGEPISNYELWIDKGTNLPYKLRREMSHDITVETISKATFNTRNIENFVASAYFPADCEIRQYRQGKRTNNPHELLGRKAPEWLLTDKDGKKIGLGDLDSKV